MISSIRFGNRPRRSAHALHPASHKHISLSTPDRAGRLVDSLQSRGTEPIHGHPGHAEGQASQQERHAGHIAVVLTRLIGATQIHIFDEIRLNSRAGHDFFDDQRGQVIGSNRSQRSAMPAHRRAYRLNDNGFSHLPPFLGSSP
jgi:hypothetical protein